MAGSRRRSAGKSSLSTAARRLRGGVAYAHRRVTILLSALSAVCLLIAYRCLQLIGPPPRLGIEALWVHNRRSLVHTLVISITVAVFASGLSVFAGRQRVIVVLLWSVGLVVAVRQFSDRLPVILRVLVQQVT